jgi:hypothetical protein
MEIKSTLAIADMQSLAYAADYAGSRAAYVAYEESNGAPWRYTAAKAAYAQAVARFLAYH